MSHRSALLFSHLAQNKTFSFVDSTDSPEEQKNSQEIIDLYIKEINRYPILSADKEGEYVSKMLESGCQQSKTALIEANLRLVVRIARRYKRHSSYLMDIIAEGNIGLIHALGKFDPTVGCRFSTYAAWWVQQYIEAFIMNHARTIRLPVYVQKKISKIKKSQEKINQKYQRAVSTQEFAQEAHLERDQIDTVMIYQENYISLSAEHQQALLENPEDEILLNQIMSPDQENDYAYEQLQNQIRDSILELPEHYREVIARRFGLIGHDFMTFKQIGIDLNITIDQVRQRYSNALARLSKEIKNKSNDLNGGYKF